MTNELSKQHVSLFEQIKQIDANGNEFWSARDLSKVLEYSEYRHFLPVIKRAKEACNNSGQEASDHFEDILDMITTGKTAQRKVDSVKLSRYACYLIVQNANSQKEEMSFAESYFTTWNTEHIVHPSSIKRLIFSINDIPVILDRDLAKLYHISASLKDLGKKPVVSEVEPWFAFSKMDANVLEMLNLLKIKINE